MKPIKLNEIDYKALVLNKDIHIYESFKDFIEAIRKFTAKFPMLKWSVVKNTGSKLEFKADITADLGNNWTSSLCYKFIVDLNVVKEEIMTSSLYDRELLFFRNYLKAIEIMDKEEANFIAAVTHQHEFDVNATTINIIDNILSIKDRPLLTSKQ